MTTDIQSIENISTNPFNDRRFMLLFAAIMLFVIATMMLVFSSAYIRDVQMLRNAPSAVWNFICGKPLDNNITLPLLLTISIAGYGLSSASLIARWIIGKRQTKVQG